MVNMIYQLAATLFLNVPSFEPSPSCASCEVKVDDVCLSMPINAQCNSSSSGSISYQIGAQVGFSCVIEGNISASTSITWTCQVNAGPCQTCYGQVCVVGNRVRIQVCTVNEPIYGYDGDGYGRCYGWPRKVIVGWVKRYYPTATYIPGDIFCSQICKATPEKCAELGHDCDTQKKSGATKTTTTMLSPQQAEQPITINFDVQRFAIGGDSYDQYASLDDLSPRQLSRLEGFLLSADSETEWPWGTNVALKFTNGNAMTGDLPSILEEIWQSEVRNLDPRVAADVNRDGIVDQADVETMREWLVLLTTDVPSRADIDNDGIFCEADVLLVADEADRAASGSKPEEK